MILPMLAVLTHEHAVDKLGWIFENKYDGMRCIIIKKGSKVTLYSRNQKKINDFFPELVKAFQKQTGNFTVDGEIVAGVGKIGSFAKLQPRMHAVEKGKHVPIRCYLFDILFDEKEDLRKLSLLERKARLKKKIKFASPLYWTPFKTKSKVAKGYEGLIAKRAHSSYLGKRSSDWQKIKAVNEQEFVIVGFTQGFGRREKAFGALLIGYYENKHLKYAGRVGTGFNEKTIQMLLKKLKPLVTKRVKDVEFVKPKLVADIRFTEWTKEGRLRHPSYVGLRIDKKPSDVKHE